MSAREGCERTEPLGNGALFASFDLEGERGEGKAIWQRHEDWSIDYRSSVSEAEKNGNSMKVT
jgi:hypothetical protein